MILVGVVGAILIGAGLIPPYWELWKRSGRVIGISPSPPRPSTSPSLKIPTNRNHRLGLPLYRLPRRLILPHGPRYAFPPFPLPTKPLSQNPHSLTPQSPAVAQETFDIIGAVLYLVVLVLEIGIFTSHLIWRLRTRKLRKRAKLEGIKFDDLPEARKYQDHPRGEDSPDLGAEGEGQPAHAVPEVPWGEERTAGNERAMAGPRIAMGESEARGDGEGERDLERGNVGVAR